MKPSRKAPSDLARLIEALRQLTPEQIDEALAFGETLLAEQKRRDAERGQAA